jgi:FkbM family methyltransferase
VFAKLKSIKTRILSKIKKNQFENLSKKLLKSPRYTVQEVKINGLKLKIPDAPSFLFSYKEIFNEDVYYFSTPNHKPYILDAGANIGLSAIYFKKLHPLSEVVAFEADPKIFEFITHNLNNNGFDDVKVINKALYSKNDSFINFSSEGADAGSLTSSHSDLNLIKVETTKLSDYICKPVDFLKIDIEGAETIVIEEIKEKLHLVNKIFIEYHSFIGETQHLHQILETLNQANFRYYLDTPGLRSQNPFKKLNTYLNMDLQVNIFAIKND